MYKECYCSKITIVEFFLADKNDSITMMQPPGLMVLPGTEPELLPVNTTCTDHCIHMADSQ